MRHLNRKKAENIGKQLKGQNGRNDFIPSFFRYSVLLFYFFKNICFYFHTIKNQYKLVSIISFTLCRALERRIFTALSEI